MDPLGQLCSITWESRRVSGAPQAGARIDLDGDGDDEVALISKSSDQLWLFYDNRGPTTIHDVGTPTALVRVDINRDGRDDLFVAGSVPAQLLPFYSAGDDTLIRGAPLPLERPILVVVARDLDGDLEPELIAVDGEHLLLMDTEGVTRTLTAGSSPIELELGDLDGDGHLDAVVLDLDGSLVSLRGDGAGSFTASATAPTSPGTRDLELRDLDGDDRLDAVVRDRLQGGILFAAGDGAGGFAQARAIEFDGDSGDSAGLLGGAFNAGSGLSSLTMALGSLHTRFYDPDFTQAGYVERPAKDDARFDLLGEGFAAGEGAVVLIEPQTGPIPIIVGETALPRKGFDVLSADFNGDARVDLAVAHQNCSVSILSGLGDGSFADAQPGPVFDLCAHTIRAADVDHDGNVDLIGHQDSTAVQLALGDGLGGFTVSARYSSDNPSLAPLVDGEPRALILLKTYDGALLPLAVDAAGELKPQTTFATPEGWPSAAGDLDGDGTEELLLTGKGVVTVLGRTGDELLALNTHVLTDISPEFSGKEHPELTLGDYDGDGIDEVLLREDNLLVVVDGLHSATPQVRSVDRIDGFPTRASIELVADFDGDGHLDHGVYRLDGDVTYVRGDGLGFSGPPYSVRLGRPHSLADLDGNGRADLLVTPGFSPGNTLFRAEARTVTMPRVEPERPLLASSEPEFLSIVDGDLDGDGLVDFVVSDRDSHSTLWGDLEGLRTRTRNDNWRGGRPILAEDLNGDGRDELVTVTSSGTAILGLGWAWDGRSWSSGFQVNLDHGAPQAAAAGDFDGDDLVDLAIAWGPTASDPTMGVAVFYAEGPTGDEPKFGPPQVLLSVIHPKAALLSTPEAEGGEANQETPEEEEELAELALRAADLDGDGRPDLLLDSDIDGALRILWNDGGREFKSAELPGRSALVLDPGVLLTIVGDSLARHNIFGRELGPAMRIADVGERRLDAVTECNGDGVPDLRLRGGTTDDARFMLGVDSTFVDYALASSPEELTRCVDVNGDGVPDLLRISRDYVTIGLVGDDKE